MTKRIISILTLIALLVIIVLQLKSNKSITENRVYQYDKMKPISVHTTTITKSSVGTNQEFTGTFDAHKDGRINADVQGKITRFYVDAGSKVRKGQSLVKLDDALLRLQLKSINVKIEGLEADEKRYKILTDANAIQGIKLEKTQMALKAARIQKNTINTKLNKTLIRAPFSGVVTMKMSEAGSFAAPGVPLLMLTDISKLKFTCNVSEANLGLFTLRKKLKIKVDAYPNLDLTGTVTSVGSKGNMGNSFPIQLTLNNTRNLKIKAKMFGKLMIEGNNNIQGITIPASTIVGSDLDAKVYVIENGKAMLKSIKIGGRINNLVVVASGLSEGDKIVSNGFINLFDGANVVLKKQ